MDPLLRQPRPVRRRTAGVVGEGLLARPAGPPRRWVPLGESIKIWVEGTPEQATDP